MFVPTVIMGVIAVLLLFLGFYKGQGQHISGMQSALGMIIEILPLLIFALIIAGMVQVLLPEEIVAKWVGVESGLRGIFIGSVAGGLCPGGPFVSLPIAAGLFRSGASIGTMVAFVTGWSIWAVIRLPMEVGILGWKLTLIRIVSTFFFPPLAGIIAQIFFGASK
ncbi:MAG: permease [Desulfatiglandales bacterium]